MELRKIMILSFVLLICVDYAVSQPKSKVKKKRLLRRQKTSKQKSKKINKLAKEDPSRNTLEQSSASEEISLDILDRYFSSLPSPDYIYGRCDFSQRPLSANQPHMRGSVSLRQSLQGGPTELLVNITGFPHKNSEHGFHVHNYGDMNEGCASTGDHYNPFGTMHGRPDNHPALRHFGDLGNLKADNKGTIKTLVVDNLISLLGPFSALGRAIVIHEQKDDFGTKKTEASLNNGSSGRALACCVIGLSDTQTWPQPSNQPGNPANSPSDTKKQTNIQASIKNLKSNSDSQNEPDHSEIKISEKENKQNAIKENGKTNSESKSENKPSAENSRKLTKNTKSNKRDKSNNAKTDSLKNTTEVSTFSKMSRRRPSRNRKKARNRSSASKLLRAAALRQKKKSAAKN